MFSMLTWVGRFMKDVQAILSLVMFLLTFHSPRSLLIISIFVFLGRLLEKLLLTLKVLYINLAKHSLSFFLCD